MITKLLGGLPNQNMPQGTFDAAVAKYMADLPVWGTEANALAADVNAKQVLASAAAVSAKASEIAAEASADSAAVATGVAEWVSATTYARGVSVWSPVNFQTYRRKTTGAGTLDPSADSANWSPARASEMVQVVITTTGTWVCPDNTTRVKLTVLGGGASCSTSAGSTEFSGAAGGTAIKYLSVTPGATYTATIGAGGAARTTGGMGNAGSTSSFSGSGITTVSATGGTHSSGHSLGGIGINGDLNIRGGVGARGQPVGGASFLSGSAEIASNGNPYGGGAGGVSNTEIGFAGASGVVIIEY